jgi:hypothetical protein
MGLLRGMCDRFDENIAAKKRALDRQLNAR